MSSKLTFGYWGIRGRGQVTRLICTYTGVQWEEKSYTNPEEWFGKDKQQLGILFPNLPYIIDRDIKISESDILPRYVIKKSGKLQLLGKDYKDMALVDNVIYVVLDLWNPLSQLFFNKKWEDQKTAAFYQLKPKLTKLDKFINNKDTTLEYLTLADFFISEFSYYVEKLFPEEYSKFKSIQNVRNNIENLEAVKTYYSTPGAVQAAFLPPNKTVFPFFLQKFQPKVPPLAGSLSNSSSSLVKSSKIKEKQPQVINNGQKLRVLLISGSLRKASLNTGLLRGCVELNNPNIEFEWVDISDFPLFNEDVEKEGIPKPVERVYNQVKHSHGILFGVPQNNSSISAALKNAYDWLSRGEDKAVIYRIPAGMTTVAVDHGGRLTQKAFKQIGTYSQVKFMGSPQLIIDRLQGEYFDPESGNLINEKIRENLRSYLRELALWIDSNKIK